ncbi:MAG: TIGR03560 family F420-dependent LLM class oxidoreductase, partial [Candidatus Heimdallarchaeota archaeon]|nr:TIGR03560 family F420-dependent LLM class oxidoreductase [Candidatus Heimdallarchaeota archaeon]
MTTKFSIQIENQAGYDWELTKKVIHKTEELGYHSFYICDHFFLDNQSENRHALEAWSVLSAAATLTNKIKLGTLVTGNNYRNPALLAKIASTLDMISNGRMEFGIGAGWKEIEYEAYGYDFPAVKDRMDMLEESILIIKEMWSKPRATFEGKHYRIKDAVLSPKPDNPLFMIGGGGEKRTLKLVAKYADYCNLFSIAPKEIDKKLAALKNHCNTIGRDYESVGKSLFIFGAFVSESQEEIDKF